MARIRVSATRPPAGVLEHRLIRRAVIDAERAAVSACRDRGAINDDAWRLSSVTWISRSCAWRLERTLRGWSVS